MSLAVRVLVDYATIAAVSSGLLLVWAVTGLLLDRYEIWRQRRFLARPRVLPFDPRSQQLQAAVGRRTP